MNEELRRAADRGNNIATYTNAIAAIVGVIGGFVAFAQDAPGLGVGLIAGSVMWATLAYAVLAYMRLRVAATDRETSGRRVVDHAGL